MRSVFRNSVLLVLGFAVAVSFAEAFLRIWPPSALAYKRVRVSHPTRHHALRPSSRFIDSTPEYFVEVAVNSLGFRDHEIPTDWQDRFRILVLGDSFTEGVGVPMDSCYVKALERRLNRKSPTRQQYAVLNMGIAGYSPLLEYLLMKDVGLSLKPDLVLLSYDVTDVREDMLYTEDATFDSLGLPLSVNPSAPTVGPETWIPKGGFRTFVHEHSYLFSLVQNHLKPRTVYPMSNIRVNPYVHTIDPHAEKYDSVFSLSERYVKFIADAARGAEIPFVLVLIPRGHQVSRLEWVEGRRWGNIGPGVYDSYLALRLQRFAAVNCLYYLDMTGAFRSHSDGSLYYTYDAHWTFRGHKVAADTLFHFIVEHSLCGPRRLNMLVQKGK
jgi:hypothetical protein